MVELVRHAYRYYPYELELAHREARALMPRATLRQTSAGIRVDGKLDRKVLDRLVYFGSTRQGDVSTLTNQGRLEQVNGNGPNRQSTRYSAHGLHEYKGKFNPQIVRAILNILDVPLRSRVLDPFCGSGTSLVECAHLGMRAVGVDINPLAVFLANAKLQALLVGADALRSELDASLIRYRRGRVPVVDKDAARKDYLASWFDGDVIDSVERIRVAILLGDGKCVAPLLAVASNLLRDYSQQDPNDLRIRRRKSPLPTVSFVDAFEAAAHQFAAKIEAARLVLKAPGRGSKAFLHDSRRVEAMKRVAAGSRFDCAVTSPPYATALPYIDTQRLSLVWLGLVPPSEILTLEAQLVGSREVKGQSKHDLLADLIGNQLRLPSAQANYCRMLQSSLADGDGFRRRAVPLLLYRYFSDMAQVFRTVRAVIKKNAPFALIVGSNHTTLGGKRFDIDTPRHLAELAHSNGWAPAEAIELETYQRFGYHMSNAVRRESLVILRAV